VVSATAEQQIALGRSLQSLQSSAEECEKHTSPHISRTYRVILQRYEPASVAPLLRLVFLSRRDLRGKHRLRIGTRQRHWHHIRKRCSVLVVWVRQARTVAHILACVQRATRSRRKQAHPHLIDKRDELVLDLVRVPNPIVAVLDRAAERTLVMWKGAGTDKNSPLKVAATAVDKNGDEEDRVEVRDRARTPDDRAPEEGHSEVGGVVRLPAVLPPAAGQQAVAAHTSSVRQRYVATREAYPCLV
jgi:hypothetical protein